MEDASAWAHQASRRIARAAADVFVFMADLQCLGQWSLGCFDTHPAGEGVVVGTSLFDGGQTFVSVETLPEQGLVRYWVGDQQSRSPRISAWVQALDAASCVLVLLATRPATMDAARWLRLQRCHETELDLIQAQLESGGRRSSPDARTVPNLPPAAAAPRPGQSRSISRLPPRA